MRDNVNLSFDSGTPAQSRRMSRGAIPLRACGHRREAYRVDALPAASRPDAALFACVIISSLDATMASTSLIGSSSGEEFDR
jgi:hypothetical protein